MMVALLWRMILLRALNWMNGRNRSEGSRMEFLLPARRLGLHTDRYASKKQRKYGDKSDTKLAFNGQSTILWETSPLA